MSHLRLSLFDGHLERKRLFNIFHFQVLKGLSHESPFSHLQLSAAEGSFARNAFLRVADAQNAVLYKTKRASKDGWGSFARHGCEAVSAVPGSWSDRPRRGTDNSGLLCIAVERAVLVCFASQSLQAALIWLHQGWLALQLRA